MVNTMSLNTDIGEGYGIWRVGDDSALLELVTDANIACGFHAGDPTIMRATCAGAAARGVSVGAQVSYPDIRGFGRRHIEMPASEITDDVLYQLGALHAFAVAAGTRLTYVAVHGALYHAAVTDPTTAHAVVAAAQCFDPSLAFLCQPGTALHEAVVAQNMRPVHEGYVDRAYSPDGLLVPRGLGGAVLSEPAQCAERAVMMATRGQVTTIAGDLIPMPAQSLCIHSDSPGAVEIARAVRSALEAAGVSLAPLG